MQTAHPAAPPLSPSLNPGTAANVSNLPPASEAALRRLLALPDRVHTQIEALDESVVITVTFSNQAALPLEKWVLSIRQDWLDSASHSRDLESSIRLFRRRVLAALRTRSGA